MCDEMRISRVAAVVVGAGFDCVWGDGLAVAVLGDCCCHVQTPTHTYTNIIRTLVGRAGQGLLEEDLGQVKAQLWVLFCFGFYFLFLLTEWWVSRGVSKDRLYVYMCKRW